MCEEMGHAVSIWHLLKPLNPIAMCLLSSSKDSFSFVFFGVNNSYTSTSEERAIIQKAK